MGQPVNVTAKKTLDPHVRVFETDRWLTGMGSGLFESADAASEGSMARVLFDTGKVAAVHVYGSCLTVTKRREASWEGLEDTLRSKLENYYIFYPENVGKKIEAFSGETDNGTQPGGAGEAEVESA